MTCSTSHHHATHWQTAISFPLPLECLSSGDILRSTSSPTFAEVDAVMRSCTDKGSFSPSGQMLVAGGWRLNHHSFGHALIRGLSSPGSCPFPGDSHGQWFINFGNNSKRPAQPSSGVLVLAEPHVMTILLLDVSLSCRCWFTFSPGKSLPVDLCLRVDFQESCAAFSMPKSSPGIPPGSHLSGKSFLDSLLLSTCLPGGYLSCSFLTQ